MLKVIKDKNNIKQTDKLILILCVPKNGGECKYTYYFLCLFYQLKVN